MENITMFDIASVGLILFLGIKGILRGFVKEFFALVGIIGGIYYGSRYAQAIGNYLDTNFLNLQNKSSLYLIGFIALFIAFWFISSVIGSFLSSIVNSSGVGIIDKLFGFIVGAAKIFFIISVMIYILSSINILKDKTNSMFKDSFMYPIFLKYGNMIVKLDKPKALTQKKEKIEIIETNSTK
jgi:membrane protein required for colicin V production